MTCPPWRLEGDLRVAESETVWLTAEERARSAWKRIGWRLGLPSMDWSKNEEAVTIIALEITQATEAAKK